MRAAILASVAIIGLALFPGTPQAAPAALPSTAPAFPAITPVAGGCGPGLHPRTWRDAYGWPHTECVPNAAPPPAAYRACPPGMYWRAWRDAYGRPHGQCVY